MIIGRNDDGRIYVMAYEYGIPAVMKKDGKWHKESLSAEELNDFTPIRDQKILKDYLKEALEFFSDNPDLM